MIRNSKILSYFYITSNEKRIIFLELTGITSIIIGLLLFFIAFGANTNEKFIFNLLPMDITVLAFGLILGGILLFNIANFYNRFSK